MSGRVLSRLRALVKHIALRARVQVDASLKAGNVDTGVISNSRDRCVVDTGAVCTVVKMPQAALDSACKAVTTTLYLEVRNAG